VALADVDGDQDLDLVTGSESWLRLELLRNQRWRAPVTYCFANADSHGCAATVAASGSASASSSAPFTLSASDVLSNKFGLLFYGHAPKSAAFHGSVLCAAPPLVRTPAQGSGGNAPPVEDCSGSFALDFNARIQAGVDPSLVAGATVTAQYWYRDPSAPSTTALSSAVRFWIRP
jgi:hypothetical protein